MQRLLNVEYSVCMGFVGARSELCFEGWVGAGMSAWVGCSGREPVPIAWVSVGVDRLNW